MSIHVDVLVVGHGLAGAAVVDECARRGLQVAVVAEARPGQASRVAAGVVNPVVLKRLVPSWRAQELLPLARSHYRGAEKRAGRSFWHDAPLEVIFASAADARQWRARQNHPELASFIDPQVNGTSDVKGIQADHGTGRVVAAAWLDVNTYLNDQQQRLCTQGHWLAHSADCSAQWTIHCTGPFADLPGLVPVKGESIVIHLPGLDLDHMVHRGVFIVPLGRDLYRVGATFQWLDVWSGPTAEARAWLLSQTAGALNIRMRERVHVVEHHAGVRPASRDRRPLIGRISHDEAVINGLGSRGVLIAPWCAQHLLDHLLNGSPLDPAVLADRMT